MAYVPDTALASADNASDDIAHKFVSAIEAVEATLPAGSPEREFLDNWRLPENDWKRTFESRIEDYFVNLQQLAATDAGFDGWTRLAESRRREFRKRPLAEFRLTTPTTNIPADAPTLSMNLDGTVA
jgi:hypothetical protein